MVDKLNIKTNTTKENAAGFLALAVLGKLEEGKKVLLFLTGGSSVEVGVLMSKILKEKDEKLFGNLSITLTDERYGPVDHFNSNFFQLKERGFDLPGVNIIPVLVDDDRNITTEKFNENLKREFEKADYKIGLFGVGQDGHTAGILPDSEAVDVKSLAFGYDTPIFSRITMTPRAIEKLDEAVVFMMGKDKWKVLESLREEVNIKKQPAQILKKVPLLTIFTDYPSSRA